MRLPPIWLLVLCTAIGPIAMTTTVPATTHIMADFATDYGTAQLTLTVFLVATGIAQLFLGGLSDQYGRRPVMLGGLAIFAIGSAMCAIAPSLEILLVGRVIQGIGSSVGMTLSRAIVRDVYSMAKSASIIGYITMGMVIAPMIGPVIGGLFTDLLSWRFIFVSIGLLTVLIGFFAFKQLNETYPADMQRVRPSFIYGTTSLLKETEYLRYVFNTAFAAGMFYAFIAGAPYYMMEVLHMSGAEYGAYSIISALGYMTGNFLSGRFSEKVGPDTMIRLALIPAFIGVTLFWLLSSIAHPLAFFIPMYFITLSNGLTIPNATAAALSVRPDLIGSSSGLSGALQIAFGATVTILVGFTQNGQPWPLLIVITGSMLMLVLTTKHPFLFRMPYDTTK